MKRETADSLMTCLTTLILLAMIVAKSEGGEEFTEAVIQTQFQATGKYQFQCDGLGGIYVGICFKITDTGGRVNLIAVNSEISKGVIKDGWYVANILSVKEKRIIMPRLATQHNNKIMQTEFQEFWAANKDRQSLLKNGDTVLVRYLLRASESDGVGRSISRNEMLKKMRNREYEITLRQEYTE